MLKAFLMICAAAGAVALAACSTDDVKNHRGETVGTAGGAVAGGAVGSAATGGRWSSMPSTGNSSGLKLRAMRDSGMKKAAR